MRRIIVHTGIIDEDYMGEIAVMLLVTHKLYLQKDDRFAQLLLLPMCPHLIERNIPKQVALGALTLLQPFQLL